jgi:hypothetical protein
MPEAPGAPGAPAPPRIFVLSPARLDGARARLLFEPRSSFAVAAGLRRREGVPIGEVFRFVSGLYFRGKLAYAQRFARPTAMSMRWPAVSCRWRFPLTSTSSRSRPASA